MVPPLDAFHQYLAPTPCLAYSAPSDMHQCAVSCPHGADILVSDAGADNLMWIISSACPGTVFLQLELAYLKVI